MRPPTNRGPLEDHRRRRRRRRGGWCDCFGSCKTRRRLSILLVLFPLTLLLIRLAVIYNEVVAPWNHWHPAFDLMMPILVEQQQQQLSTNRQDHQRQQLSALYASKPCAILFFGLPRSFQSLVLPSLTQHVIRPNAPYGCDYFVHYYNLTFEQAGRSGNGGTLDPHEIRLLEQVVSNLSATTTTTTNNSEEDETRHTNHFHYHQHGKLPIVMYDVTQEADFWKQYKNLLDLTRTAKDDHGNPLYHPWKENTYHRTQIANIFKMWHSMQSAFALMEAQNVSYQRVAMLRSDVFYMTPIDIWERGKKSNGDGNNNIVVSANKNKDVENRVVVVPDFAKYPVNDRMIYGPYEAVRTWSTTRFAALEDHVQWVLQNKPGYGMHSETFVSRLLERIEQQQGYKIEEHETLCFFRVRADESIWIDDCSQEPPFAGPKVRTHLPTDIQTAVEGILGGRSCYEKPLEVTPETTIMTLQCPVDPTIYYVDD